MLETCPHCARAIPAGAPVGLCPSCLLTPAVQWCRERETEAAPAWTSEEEGAHIGPYRLIHRLGEGGFGVVWEAEQEEPVRRRVALKIIKLGMDTREVIARFEQERQALALMEHPHIARVFDAGATQSGRPYFVMELVRGARLTEFCERERLAVAERLRLFIAVCQAVQHAHQKGIIHRDLKPSNILVARQDGVAVPKVIDFGVAKATEARLTDGTLFTPFAQMIGTPLYMSPEQAALTSLDIDTRSDIYSLGVLLYELLTGRLPIDPETLRTAGLDEVRRLIREVDPPRPSAREKTLGSGDLDWIVMKCLEKDRTRRYDTAAGLAHDLQRHLADEAVSARPPTARYLAGRFIQRHRVGFAAGAAIALTICAGLAVSLSQGLRAQREAARATAALAALRETAPAFADQARGLVEEGRFDEALARLAHAVTLRPDVADYPALRGDFLQSQLRLAEAATAYRAALAIDPAHRRARTSEALCVSLLNAPPGADGKLSRKSLSALLHLMQAQERTAAECFPVASLLGEQDALLIDYWAPRLRTVPLPPGDSIKKRLSVRTRGEFSLDLHDTRIVDLTPLAPVPLRHLNLSECDYITDFTPLRELRELERLDLSDTKIRDLSPLRGLPLKTLGLKASKASDLSPLAGMRLERLNLRTAKVSDITPLAGMPITAIDLSSTGVEDFSLLAGMPLQECVIGDTKVRDLAFLRGLPIRRLVLGGCLQARNFAVLMTLPQLEELELPEPFGDLPEEDLVAIGALRHHPTLQHVIAHHLPEAPSADLFWALWDGLAAVVLPLRRSGLEVTLRVPDRTRLQMGLTIKGAALHELAILKDAPIAELELQGCEVTDLSPIAALPLSALFLNKMPLTDLTPLRQMPLETLHLSATRVTDLAPLRGLPLRHLNLHGSKGLNDLTPLAAIESLESLVLPAKATGLEILRTHPGLKRLSFEWDKTAGQPKQTAAEFWAEYDAGKP